MQLEFTTSTLSVHVCVNFCQIGLKATWKALSKPTDFSIHYQVLYFHRIENPWVLMMHRKLVMNTLQVNTITYHPLGLLSDPRDLWALYPYTRHSLIKTQTQNNI